MNERYIVSKNLPPEQRKAGMRAEIVDCTHPSDGGPVAIAWTMSEAKAAQIASALNLLNTL